MVSASEDGSTTSIDLVTYPAVTKLNTQSIAIITLLVYMASGKDQKFNEPDSQVRLGDVQYCLPCIEALVHECA